MRSLLLALVMSVVALCAEAATPRWIRSVINWVDSSDFAGCDTAYVRMPREGFTAYLNTYTAGSRQRISLGALTPQGQEVPIKGVLRTTPSVLLSAGLTYRGWGLSYSRDFSSTDDTELSFTFYGQRYGAEARIHDSYSLHGQLSAVGGYDVAPCVIDERNGRYRTALLNVYYVFNRRHFSHPAATSHTMYQLRSCGSWLAYGNYYHSSYRRYSGQLPDGLQRLSLSHIGLGGGYAYNYVFGHQHCLLHGSLAPIVTVWTRYLGYYPEYSMDFGQDVSFSMVSHVHFVCNMGRYLAGTQSILNYNMVPSSNHYGSRGIDWLTRVFIGIRF